MLQVWLKRTLLQSELEEHKILDVKQSGDEDYQCLLKLSKPWWNVAKLFKTRRLPFGSRLSVPKEFSMPAEQPQLSQDTVKQVRSTHWWQKAARVIKGWGYVSKAGKEELVEGEPSQMQDLAGREEEQGLIWKDNGGLHEVAMEEVRLAEGAGEDNSGFLLGEGEVELSDDEAIEEDESGPIPAWVGGDCHLARAMEQMQEAAEHMTPGESQNLTGLIQQILESRRRGEYDLMIDSLNKRAKEAAQYESRAQQPDNTEELDSQGSAGEDIAQGDESVAESEGAEV
ncbi:hypothetical protein FRC06_008189 [Ceratobasidium sp. 370]|nr:hypothetical protein FRC06_008189 [Ceratobasidium sp. 370]